MLGIYYALVWEMPGLPVRRLVCPLLNERTERCSHSFEGSLSMMRFSSSVNAMGKSNDLEKGDSKGKSYDINSCIQSSSAKSALNANNASVPMYANCEQGRTYNDLHPISHSHVLPSFLFFHTELVSPGRCRVR